MAWIDQRLSTMGKLLKLAAPAQYNSYRAISNFQCKKKQLLQIAVSWCWVVYFISTKNSYFWDKYHWSWLELVVHFMFLMHFFWNQIRNFQYDNTVASLRNIISFIHILTLLHHRSCNFQASSACFIPRESASKCLFQILFMLTW